MFLCGESITYDLEALETDPQAIIALLKATASERGSWMIVAGQYRRKGNPSAALTVMTTMIEGQFLFVKLVLVLKLKPEQ
jgi:hypothetical protein